MITKFLIVEDEPISARILAGMIENLRPGYRLANVTSSVEATVDFLQDNSVDLIFMDIELEDDNCFEIFKRIDVQTPIIFTTAYNEFAIRAFRVNSIDYLLKPIEEDDLAAALDKFARIGRNAGRDAAEIYARLHRDLFGKSMRKRLLVTRGDTFFNIDTNDVACFVSEEKYTFAYMLGGDKYIVDPSLDMLIAELDERTFFRAARNCIVNISAIGSVVRHSGGRLKLKLRIKLNPDTEIIVSQARREHFLRWYGGDDM